MIKPLKSELVNYTTSSVTYKLSQRFKLAYIVSLYFGERRVEAAEYKRDKLFYLRKHTEQLSKLKHSCSKIVFVINQVSLHKKEVAKTFRAVKLIRDFEVKHPDKKVYILVRKNLGMSYAAWDEALKRRCKDVDYAFLIEDDYCPVSNNFDEKFLHYFTKNKKLAYVCQLWLRGFNKWQCEFPQSMNLHAAMSNGLLSVGAYFSSGGFKIHYGTGYLEGERNQRHFLDPLKDRGYEFRDNGDVYRNDFLNHPDELKLYGNKDGEDLILPIHEKAAWAAWANLL